MSAGAQDGGQMRTRIDHARKLQHERYVGLKRSALINAHLSSKEIEKVANLTAEAERFLKDVFDKAFISARGYYRILKTARTIADLEESKVIEKNHLAEAFQYRVRAEVAQ
jgi:magnesium chelatase family protein